MGAPNMGLDPITEGREGDGRGETAAASQSAKVCVAP